MKRINTYYSDQLDTLFLTTLTEGGGDFTHSNFPRMEPRTSPLLRAAARLAGLAFFETVLLDRRCLFHGLIVSASQVYVNRETVRCELQRPTKQTEALKICFY
jgi:hypothetical protein